MSEKLKRLAEAQAALNQAQADHAAVRQLLHAAEYGRIADIRNERGNAGPVDKRYLISTNESSVLKTALRAHLKVTEAGVADATREIEGMLK